MDKNESVKTEALATMAAPAVRIVQGEEVVTDVRTTHRTNRTTFVPTDPRTTVQAAAPTTPITPTTAIGSKSTGKTNLPDTNGKACYYVPLLTQPNMAEYMTVVELCDAAQARGKSRGWAVNLTGRDGGKNAPAKGFDCFIWGGRKYVKRTALSLLITLAKAA